jgi:molybdenum cofactor cytidylyltransferase
MWRLPSLMAGNLNVDFNLTGNRGRIHASTVIPAIILAAGKSSRMGRTKATLPLGANETFVSRIIRTLRDAEVDDIIVVVGHDAEAVTRDVVATGANARVVLNQAYESGQLSSVLAGLSAVDHPGVEGVLLTLVDVPLVASSTVRAILKRYHEARPLVVRPIRGQQHGHPILLDRSLFERLRGADPDSGIKPIVRMHVSPAGDVLVSDAGAFTDVDTPDEYARLMER